MEWIVTHRLAYCVTRIFSRSLRCLRRGIGLLKERESEGEKEEKRERKGEIEIEREMFHYLERHVTLRSIRRRSPKTSQLLKEREKEDERPAQVKGRHSYASMCHSGSLHYPSIIHVKSITSVRCFPQQRLLDKQFSLPRQIHYPYVIAFANDSDAFFIFTNQNFFKLMVTHFEMSIH